MVWLTLKKNQDEKERLPSPTVSLSLLSIQNNTALKPLSLHSLTGSRLVSIQNNTALKR